MIDYYRIKINEFNSGKKQYILQRGYLLTTRGFIQRQRIEWKDISSPLDTEQEALDLMEDFKKMIKEQNENKLKSTSYKIID